MNRLTRIVDHVQPSHISQQIAPQPTSGSKSLDDVVICSAVRTAIGRARKGSFKDTHPGSLLGPCLKGVLDRTGLEASLVGDIVVGNVSGVAGFAAQARMAQLVAGYPYSVPISTANRQCSSGLQSVAHVAAAIKSGYYDIGVAAGVESMTKSNMMDIGEIDDAVFENENAQQCLFPMGQTSEVVAKRYNITREMQDTMAAESNRRAVAATEAGLFTEIIPITTTFTDKKGETKTITVTKDDGPRKGTTVAKLAKLRAAFGEDGTTTAGNASQTSDGAAAVLLMTRRKAMELKMPILGAFRGYSVVGVKPDEMGVGPAVAIPHVLAKANVSIDEVGVYEINEAFASQAVYCVNKLGIDMKKVNPLGGAIALGHPLGCTGARQVATLMPELKRRKARFGVVSMCIGTGMGAACLIENEQ